MILAQDTPLVILDEPTASLDPLAEQEVFRRFGGYSSLEEKIPTKAI